MPLTHRWRLDGVTPQFDGDLARRVWAKDSSAWGPGEDDPKDRLGWLTLGEDMQAHLDRLSRFAADVAGDGITEVVLLGMGGSSLAPEVFSEVLAAAPGRPKLTVLDSTHPAQIASVRSALDLERTLFLVSSKSGGTIETLSLYRLFRSLIDDGSHFVAITDPGTSLEKLAANEGFRDTWLNPPDIGGRYSALSLFGLVPAALIGANVATLLEGARAAEAECGPIRAPEENPGLVIGSAIGALARDGRDKLTFVMSEDIAPFGDWVEQLIAESTGKLGKGITPVVGEPRADPGSYGPDRVFVALGTDAAPVDSSFTDAVVAAGHPLITETIASPARLGEAMFTWEFATAVAGSILQINAFDQPNVEAAKKAGREVLESNDEIKWADEDPDALFSGMSLGELGAVLAFAPRDARRAGVIRRARTKLVEEHSVATMSGFGPRYLHSTGQLQKGGRKEVRALVILDEPTGDEPIPGSPYGFARLVRAQAEGDARALREAGRKVARTTWPTFESWVEKA
jgi:glucose-6-phosphate isomerase